MTDMDKMMMIEKAKALREECRKGVEERGVMPNYVDACVALNHMAPKLLEHIESLTAYDDRLREALEKVFSVTDLYRDVFGSECLAKLDKAREALSPLPQDEAGELRRAMIEGVHE